MMQDSKSYENPRCRKCGSHFIGKPWEVRVCSNCDIWMSPDYFHPDAPKEIQAEGKYLFLALARSIIAEYSNLSSSQRAALSTPATIAKHPESAAFIDSDNFDNVYSGTVPYCEVK